MITEFLLTLIIGFISLCYSLIFPLMPTIPVENLYSYVDRFFDMVKVGLNGFNFIAGPLPFELAQVILGFYVFYYTIFIVVKYILKALFH